MLSIGSRLVAIGRELHEHWKRILGLRMEDLIDKLDKIEIICFIIFNSYDDTGGRNG